MPSPKGTQSIQAPQATAADQGTPASPLPLNAAFAGLPTGSVDTAQRLRDKPRVTVAFPPCTDELLALVRAGGSDDITRAFTDYFKRSKHRVFGQEQTAERSVTPPADPKFDELDRKLGNELDGQVLRCSSEDKIAEWPKECCVCSPCVTLDGLRNQPEPASASLPGIRRLFVGDVVWLFYYERMGIQQILGAILDAFATTGRLPISNGSLEASTVKDDIVALILEVMVRQTKMGLSSSVRDRGALYRTTIGWESAPSRGLGLDTELNTGFSTLFHRFIYNALEFYRDKRLAIAIQSTTTPRASAATLVTISDTIDLLKKRFEAFDYGRNYYNTLAGIVWTIAGMSVIRELRNTLGIPTAALENPYEYIPAAYDLLVLRRPFTRSEMSRYDTHRACAVNARHILLDLEVLRHSDQATNPPGELDRWLEQIESKVEAYRTAYRNLTGVDLGASPTPPVEQQVPAMA